jgi:hypothetical protein
VARVVVALIAIALTTACSSPGDEIVGPWADASGSIVPADRDHGFVIESYRGPEHCNWDSVIFLEAAWPPGSMIDDVVYDDPGSTPRIFLRDEIGRFAEYDRGTFRANAVLPPDAQASGLRRGAWSLWTAGSAPSYVFLVSEENVERWPEGVDLPGCALSASRTAGQDRVSGHDLTTERGLLLASDSVGGLSR